MGYDGASPETGRSIAATTVTIADSLAAELAAITSEDQTATNSALARIRRMRQTIEAHLAECPLDD